jgi:undecaprenyl-diphosphatase
MDLVQTRRLGSREARRAATDIRSRAATAWQSPVQRRLLVAIASACLAALAFAHVAEDYVTNDPLARWDVSFARWLALERSDLGTEFFRVFTFLGSPAVALAVSAVACIALYRRRLLVQAALLPLVLGGAEFLNLGLKLAFHRPRPEVAFVSIDTYSFPSGHAMASTAAYGALAYIAWAYVRSPRRRVLLVAGTIVFVALICFSRLYLGVHYLSDVLAGAAGGLFWLSVSVAIMTLWGARLVQWFAGSRADAVGRRITRSSIH